MSWIKTIDDIARKYAMGQDVTEKQLFEALALYKDRYGKANIEPSKWDDIVTEVKYGKTTTLKPTRGK